MNYIAFTCKVIGERFKISCVRNPHMAITVRTGIKALLGIGVVTVIPSVSAQSKTTDFEKVDKTHDADKNAGWERLKAVFKYDEYGNLSKEMTAVSQSTCFACFIGLIYGGVKSSRVAFQDFMERNQATIFETPLDAKRRLQNHVTVHFGKGGFRWALRLSLFTSGFMLFLTSMSVYRGSSSIVDYMVSGSMVGGLLRLRLGPPAVLVGSTVGCILGCFCGLSTQGLFYLTDSSLDDIIAFQYELDKKRLQLFKQAEAEQREEELSDQQTVVLLKDRDEPSKIKAI